MFIQLCRWNWTRGSKKYNLGEWNITSEEQSNSRKQNTTQEKMTGEIKLAMAPESFSSTLNPYKENLLIMIQREYAIDITLLL